MTRLKGGRLFAVAGAVLSIFIFLAGNAHAQCSQTSQSFSISGGLLTSPEVLFLSNFNLLQSSSSQPLFRVAITSHSAVSQSVRLRFTLFSQKFNQVIYEARSMPFQFSQNDPPKSITNSDIVNSTLPGIDLDFINVELGALAELTTAILKNGKFPADRLELAVTLSLADGREEACLIIVIDIKDPESVDLIGPGEAAGQSDFYPEIHTDFPQFSWASNADKFILTVCEVMSYNVSPEDVMQNEPRARLCLERGKDFFGSPSFLYPSTNVFPLEEGKTYYWQIQTVVSSPSGDIFIPGEIFAFRKARTDAAMQQILGKSIMEAFIAILKGTKYEYILEPGGPLSGYTPSGGLQINGKAATIYDLNALLPDFLAKIKKVTGVTIEKVGE